jgi:hypothetical protein
MEFESQTQADLKLLRGGSNFEEEEWSQELDNDELGSVSPKLSNRAMVKSHADKRTGANQANKKYTAKRGKGRFTNTQPRPLKTTSRPLVGRILAPLRAAAGSAKRF